MNRLAVAFVLLFPGATCTLAQINDDMYVPEDLQDWQEWVLYGYEYLNCPFFMNQMPEAEASHVCAWPGTLELRASAAGAGFSQDWQVYEDAWVPLPGDPRYWPINAQIDGDDAVVVQRNGRPQLRVSPGNHRVSGQFLWQERPSTLRIPDQTGRIDLIVDGNPIQQPERDNRGVFLGQRRGDSTEREDIALEVFRLIDDGVPVFLTTVIELDVSGRAREELLGQALPAGFIPVAMTSQLAARIEPDGGLRMQVRPGTWQITIRARAERPVDAIVMPTQESQWPKEEIWSFRSDERIRVAVAEGLPPVDVAQTATPWKQLPGFRAVPGEGLQIVVRSRGLSDRDANQLSLNRSLWLDFDRGGFTARDFITGKMRQGWRLDTTTPLTLMSARIGNDNLLVTRGGTEGQVGVEVRAPDLSLDSVARMQTDGSSVPVTGWQTRFDSVDTTLHLPPGHRLGAAIGADQSYGDWIGRWDLLDFFLVLVIAVAFGKLLGPIYGVFALAGVALLYHEPGAPAWVWLSVLAGLALARVAPQGRLKQIAVVYRNLSVAVLIILLVPFVANQLKLALYPQLERLGYGTYQAALYGSGDNLEFGRANKPAAPKAQRRARDQVLVDEQMAEEPVAAESVAGGMMRSRIEGKDLYSRYAPDALVQSGPGLPSWQWNSYRLSWSGPVDPGQNVRLVILNPLVVSILRVVGVGLIALLLLGLSQSLFRRPRLSGVLKPAAGLLLAAIVAGGAGYSQQALADDPPRAPLLKELRARLTKPPECAPRCAEILSADISVDADRLSMMLEANGLESVAIPLPGSINGWEPESIVLDGTTQRNVYRDGGNTIWVRIGPGTHRIELSGRVPPLDTLTLPFPERPRRVTVQAQGWEVSGVVENNLVAGAVELLRTKTTGAGETTQPLESERFPVFARVVRELVIDIDWQVVTTVYRISPANGAWTLEVPLLEGESVLTEGIEVSDGKALVAMGSGASSVSWRSRLVQTPTVQLEAPDRVSWIEIWSVAASQVWNVVQAGTPVIAPAHIDPSFWLPEFHPEPGESLELTITRPVSAGGETLAIDRVNLQTNVGKRSSETSVQFDYRSTRGAQHVITIPEAAELLDLSSDGRSLHLSPDQGRLRLPVEPGNHTVQLRWRDTGDIGFRSRTPFGDLGAQAGNIQLNLSIPDNRWVLFTSGPELGPAILYWSELAVFFLIAWILGRSRVTPLRTHQWLLLGLGFSTFSWWGFAIVALWLFAVAWRKTWDTDVQPRTFNIVQLLLGGLTIAALFSLLTMIPQGLLGTPDMHVTGYGSYANSLNWFADQTDGVLPHASAISIPLWIYKIAILLWALWLAFALVRWLPWVWHCLSSGGLWKSVKLQFPTRKSRRTEDVPDAK